MANQLTPERLAATGTEHGHQAALFYWAAQNINQYSQLKWLFAIPNGGLRYPATAARMKAEGVKSGVPDIMLAVPVDNGYTGPRYTGLFIEMKVGKNVPTDEQKEWLKYLGQAGYFTAVCYSWIEARYVILKYLNGE